MPGRWFARSAKDQEESMPRIQAGNITMNYDRQGSGEPLVLIPYLAADYACYAFQVADYSKQFTCVLGRSARDGRVG